jgi:hypothetical protein
MCGRLSLLVRSLDQPGILVQPSGYSDEPSRIVEVYMPQHASASLDNGAVRISDDAKVGIFALFVRHPLQVRPRLLFDAAKSKSRYERDRAKLAAAALTCRRVMQVL